MFLPTLQWSSNLCSLSALSLLSKVALPILNFWEMTTNHLSLTKHSWFLEMSNTGNEGCKGKWLFSSCPYSLLTLRSSQAWEMHHYGKEALNYAQLFKMLEVPPCTSNTFVTLVMISSTKQINNWTKGSNYMRKGVIKSRWEAMKPHSCKTNFYSSL